MRHVIPIGLAIAALAAAVLVGCGADTPTADTITSTSAAPTVDAADSAADSAVGIVADGCSLVAQLGSGVVLGEPGRVVTAAHTIAGTSAITVVDRNGVEHAATVRAFDADADLAVVAAPTLDAPPLGLATTSGIGSGSVLVWNRDDGVVARPIEIVRRLAITIEDIYVENTVLRSGIEISGDIEVGDSGAAVLDADGRVTGIVYANSRRRDLVAFATDATEIADLLTTISDHDIDADVDNGRCV